MERGKKIKKGEIGEGEKEERDREEEVVINDGVFSSLAFFFDISDFKRIIDRERRMFVRWYPFNFIISVRFYYRA